MMGQRCERGFTGIDDEHLWSAIVALGFGRHDFQILHLLEPLDILAGHGVRRAIGQRLAIILKRAVVLSFFQICLSKPVIGLGVGAELNDLQIGVDRGVPLAAGRVFDRGFYQSPAVTHPVINTCQTINSL
jgi:hypothetical protein